MVLKSDDVRSRWPDIVYFATSFGKHYFFILSTMEGCRNLNFFKWYVVNKTNTYSSYIYYLQLLLSTFLLRAEYLLPSTSVSTFYRIQSFEKRQTFINNNFQEKHTVDIYVGQASVNLTKIRTFYTSVYVLEHARTG